MSILFSAGEIFDIAIQIERNGAAFYHAAAEAVSDPKACAELLDLAKMEEGHEVVFGELKNQLIDSAEPPEWYDSEDEAALYLENFTSGRVFDMTLPATIQITQETTLHTLLEFALQRERDSIAFFTGMQTLVPPAQGADKITAIIRQEMGHVTLIGRRLAELGPAKAGH